MRAADRNRGFALVLVLTLIALLVLAVFGLTSLARVDARVATAESQRTQARQNALLALTLALGQLQRHAGPDNRTTGMAGVAGVLPQSTFRPWTGVWGGTPSPVWLASGAGNSPTPALTGPRLTIVGSHSVGSPTDTTDQEPVEVGLINVPGLDFRGLTSRTGRIAYWVGDEGVKVSAITAADEVQLGGTSGAALRPDFRRLIGGTFNPNDAANARYLSLEQLRVGVTGFSLSPAFHSLTRTHLALAPTTGTGTPRPGSYVVGAFNVNTTSEAAWRSILDYPDSNAPTYFGLTATRSLSAARLIRDRMANRGQPFGSVAELLNSGIIQSAFDNATPKIISPTQEEFIDELRPLLTARSDTFRIRGYGDVIDPADASVAAATAYCEAIVQRTPETASGGFGRRFVVTYFRWLGRDDI